MNIKDIEQRIKELESIKKILEEEINEGDTLETIIYKAYIHYESVSKVADYINGLGYRKWGKASNKIKYGANDISNIIRNKKACVREDIKEVVTIIFNSNRRYYTKKVY